MSDSTTPFYMKVAMPIEVCTGEHCWEFGGLERICTHFRNDGGHSLCDLGLDEHETLKTFPTGVRKPKLCLNLTVIDKEPPR